MKSILLIGINGRQRDVAEAVCNQFARKTVSDPTAEYEAVVADVSNGEQISFEKPVVKIAKQGSIVEADAYYSDNIDLRSKLYEQLLRFGAK